jgi:hypothetical protein
MPTVNASFSRDNNRVPITTDGVTIFDSQTLSANNTTAAVPLFTVTGTVEIRAIWGTVTTALSSNITAAYWRLNDASAQSDITLNTGTTLSSAATGSTIVKKGLAAAALLLLTSAQERVSEPTTLETTFFSPFVAVAKNGATTNIEFVYSTTNTPATGAIQFAVRFLPISSDGTITAL